jgi:UDP-N-acetylglucosamine diphosphorylase / glucose-1-phosphate thymidylyltransferase / UDP-N-acetylgalactosamine diphosphorylase / glucosamine-1-phosphate N-acetyltransferase / galactosamine-1-phosphate N-acetyltransferase
MPQQQEFFVMYTRYIIEDKRHVPPFNEPASVLTIGTKPLKLHQEELFFDVFREGMALGDPLEDKNDLRQVVGSAIVYRDNLWFDGEFLDDFMRRARKSGRACRAAIPADDRAFRTYTLPLTKGFDRGKDENNRNIFLIDLWYFPNGYTPDILPIVVESDFKEKGFYNVPDFMAANQQDLTHYLPARAVLSIESWVHVYFGSIIFGVFTRGSRFEEHVKKHNFKALQLLWRGILEQKQVLSTSDVVKVGKDTVIHPTAQISGPTTIGDRCFIGPGVVIDNCSIGNDVSIDQGCQLMLSTVADRCFLPFRSALYLTSMMEGSILAQNTCLQMCVIGRYSFVGAGNTFTDFNLIAQKPIRAANIEGEIESVGQIVLGSAVGHNCRIGSGLIVFPGRMIESDVVLVASPSRRVISRNVTYEESDHHFVKGGDVHKRLFPRAEDEGVREETWDTW